MAIIEKNVLEIKLSAYYTSAFNWQQRRHTDWKENYELYRDKVMVNRLTQRQSVNIPLMKETIKTILAHIDDAPAVTYESLSNNKQGELFLNEYRDWAWKMDKVEIKDVVDKKQVLLYGISSKRLMLDGGKICSEVLDPHDVLFDRYADPTDIDATAKIIIVQHIYSSLSSLKKNAWYDTEAIKRLESFYATEAGLIKAAETARAAQEKNQRMQDMGVPDIDNPAVGELIIELTHNYVRVWDEKAGSYEIHLAVKGGSEILMDKPLEEVIGKTEDNYWRNHFPITTWSDDVERTDIYPDGVADIVRTPNKIANAWFSQLVENRTLRNFGMNFYDNTNDKGFFPQTWTPIPWGWYPVPGDPNKIVKSVEIPDLSDSLDELGFVVNMVERATAATSQEKGQSSVGKVTLGEIQLVAQKALERITAMAKFYRLANEEFAYKWYKMVEANQDYLDPVKLYKKSARGNFFEKEINPADWKDKAGYRVKVVNPSQQEEESLKELQKLKIVVTEFPANTPLKSIYQKKLLDLASLTPDEQKEVLDFEKQSAEQAAALNAGGGAPGGLPAPSPMSAPGGKVTLDQVLSGQPLH